MKKRPDNDTEDARRQIIARPDDEALLSFLLEVFHVTPNDAPPGKVKDSVDVMPDRITLRVCILREDGREDVGPLIFGKEYKPTVSPCPKIEELIGLCNQLIAKAQHDASQSSRKRIYTVQAFNTVKSAEAFARHLVTMVPRQRELAIINDEDSAALPTQKLLLGLLESERRDKRWMAELAMHAVSGIVEQQNERIEQLQGIVDGDHSKRLEYMQAAEQMLNQAADRKAAQAWVKWKQEKIDLAVEKAIAGAELLLPQLVKKLPAMSSGANPVRDFVHSMSEEQCVALFGAADEVNKAVSGAIFTNSQFQMILQLVDRLDDKIADDLIASITPEQFEAAKAILPLNLLGPLAQWITSRVQAQAAANGAQS
jgi:hypothetical protein